MDALSVIGHLDGLRGAYLVGWAVSPAIDNCDIVVTDSDDNIIAQGLASVEREDLRSVAGGRCNVAFKIPVRDLHRTPRLHVWANGTEIAQSPLRLGPGYFDGQIWVSGSVIEGWVVERIPDCSPPEITIVDQHGLVVMRSRARIDTNGSDPFFTPARFSAELDDICFNRGELYLTAFADGVKFATSACHLRLQGYLDTIAADRCTGWILSPDAPNRSFTFDIWRNGVRVARARCDRSRDDVQAKFPGSGACGFDVALPPEASAECDIATISLRLAGSAEELFDGPYLLGSRQALVQTARRVTRLALGAPPERLGAAEKALLQAAMSDFLHKTRQTPCLVLNRQPPARTEPAEQARLNIIIPVYRGVEITRLCIESVLSSRDACRDRVIVVNDQSPEPDMADMLGSFRDTPNLFLLSNESNLGFVRSANRGLAFCVDGDVVLLNADTRVFAGGLTELWDVAHASPDIGTVTALSNNATIFSYPHASRRAETLEDISWEDLAAIAIERNRGGTVDVPTGHGFCLFIKREVLRRIGQLDEAFGRGYGEENDFCARAADLGYRNVAASGVLVLHHESISFTGDKSALLAENLRVLEKRYPEYPASIWDLERREDLRAARWALDAARLERASEAGMRFAVIVCHTLGGGTNRAIADIEETVGYGGAQKIMLSCRRDGFMELTADLPAMRAIFAPGETAFLLQTLAAAQISLVIVHHVLGFPVGFMTGLQDWLRDRRGIFYAHDFYPICPRVTMIDAVDRFCALASTDICERCIAVGGAHESSRFNGLGAAAHRSLFGAFLGAFKTVVAPSESAASYYRSAFPGLAVETIPHPANAVTHAAAARDGTADEVVLLGAIGPHKGSGTLVDIAQLARLTHPALRFNVIGHTDRDHDLLQLGNVTISGHYAPGELPGLLASAKGRLALFLSGWPETYSYTLTEAVSLGFLPLVPDIGAPAERVRATGFGAIFGFPIIPSEVLALIADISSGRIKPCKSEAPPASFFPSRKSIMRTKTIYGLQRKLGG
jgi:GT2 family glycosyltransferase